MPAISAQTMLVFADADGVQLSHIAEYYRLFGGGLSDAGWDGSTRPKARLAVLPRLTHYDIMERSLLADVVDDFFA